MSSPNTRPPPPPSTTHLKPSSPTMTTCSTPSKSSSTPHHHHHPPAPLSSPPHTQESNFYQSLLLSPFVTQDPFHAHLFFLPFPYSISTRNLARLIRNIRVTFPFWNRTLGADHFYLSSAGLDSSSDRNVVELKKNFVQISCFPASSGLFIPHSCRG
ncbi:hypothetical protein SSX86_033102 [Deinandra increscens subsp. villosa]|uniref:Exostosin GT47 domain-containing protein n=1 Tax=Deinandra increscens subsp. villosa TaxID=3103831 RepID=A0AAP0C2J0_9ASTR